MMGLEQGSAGPEGPVVRLIEAFGVYGYRDLQWQVSLAFGSAMLNLSGKLRFT